MLMTVSAFRRRGTLTGVKSVLHRVDVLAVGVPLRRRATRLVRTPPGQLGLLLGILVTLCLATGVAGAADVSNRRGVLNGIAEQSSPLTNAALQIYQSLSDADATANSVFLAGDQAPADLRERYSRDITQAAAAMSTASAVAPDTRTANTVTELTAQLPVYAGLVETAQANNRQGHAVGSNYLQEASALVREQLLPAAKGLYNDELARLDAAQDDAGSVAWLPLGLGVVTLIVLLAGQLYLRRTTRRTLNLGLLVATGAVLAGLGWLVLASSSAARHDDAGRRDGSAQIEAIARARTAALTARSAEALILIVRGDDSSYKSDFEQARQLLDGDAGTPGLLAAARDRVHPARAQLDVAIDQWGHWRELHQKLRGYDDSGYNRRAVWLATGIDTGGADPLSEGTQAQAQPWVVGGDTTALFAKIVDEALNSALEQAKDRFDTETASAGSALAGADAGVVALLTLAAIGVAFGMSARLREYR